MGLFSLCFGFGGRGPGPPDRSPENGPESIRRESKKENGVSEAQPGRSQPATRQNRLASDGELGVDGRTRSFLQAPFGSVGPGASARLQQVGAGQAALLVTRDTADATLTQLGNEGVYSAVVLKVQTPPPEQIFTAAARASLSSEAPMHTPLMQSALASANASTLSAPPMQPSTSFHMAGGPNQRDENRRKLVPVWCNSTCMDEYGLSSARDYAQKVLQRLALRDPLLVYVLQKVINSLTSRHGGGAASMTHVTADPASTIPSLIGLRITGCWWMEDGSVPEPALIVEHGVGYEPSEVVPRILRDYCTLSLLPTIVTVVTFEGRVLYQNASSLAYLGDFASPNTQLGAQHALGAVAAAAAGAGGAGAGGVQPPSPLRGNTSALDMGPSMLSSLLGSQINGNGLISGQALGAAALMQAQGSGRLGSTWQGPVPDNKNLFKQLFCLDPDALEEMLDELSLNNRWAGVVQVPQNIKRHMRNVARRAAQVHSALSQLAAAGYSGAHMGAGAAGAGPPSQLSRMAQQQGGAGALMRTVTGELVGADGLLLGAGGGPGGGAGGGGGGGAGGQGRTSVMSVGASPALPGAFGSVLPEGMYSTAGPGPNSFAGAGGSLPGMGGGAGARTSVASVNSALNVLGINGADLLTARMSAPTRTGTAAGMIPHRTSSSRLQVGSVAGLGPSPLSQGALGSAPVSGGAGTAGLLSTGLMVGAGGGGGERPGPGGNTTSNSSWPALPALPEGDKYVGSFGEEDSYGRPKGPRPSTSELDQAAAVAAGGAGAGQGGWDAALPAAHALSGHTPSASSAAMQAGGLPVQVPVLTGPDGYVAAGAGVGGGGGYAGAPGAQLQQALLLTKSFPNSGALWAAQASSQGGTGNLAVTATSATTNYFAGPSTLGGGTTTFVSMEQALLATDGLEWASDFNILSSPQHSFTAGGGLGANPQQLPAGLAPVVEVQDEVDLDLDLEGGGHRSGLPPSRLHAGQGHPQQEAQQAHPGQQQPTPHHQGAPSQGPSSPGRGQAGAGASGGGESTNATSSLSGAPEGQGEERTNINRAASSRLAAAMQNKARATVLGLTGAGAAGGLRSASPTPGTTFLDSQSPRHVHSLDMGAAGAGAPLLPNRALRASNSGGSRQPGGLSSSPEVTGGQAVLMLGGGGPGGLAGSGNLGGAARQLSGQWAPSHLNSGGAGSSMSNASHATTAHTNVTTTGVAGGAPVSSSGPGGPAGAFGGPGAGSVQGPGVVGGGGGVGGSHRAHLALPKRVTSALQLLERSRSSVTNEDRLAAFSGPSNLVAASASFHMASGSQGGSYTAGPGGTPRMPSNGGNPVPGLVIPEGPLQGGAAMVGASGLTSPVPSRFSRANTTHSVGAAGYGSAAAGGGAGTGVGMTGANSQATLGHSNTGQGLPSSSQDLVHSHADLSGCSFSSRPSPGGLLLGPFAGPVSGAASATASVTAATVAAAMTGSNASGGAVGGGQGQGSQPGLPYSNSVRGPGTGTQTSSVVAGDRGGDGVGSSAVLCGALGVGLPSNHPNASFPWNSSTPGLITPSVNSTAPSALPNLDLSSALGGRDSGAQVGTPRAAAAAAAAAGGQPGAVEIAWAGASVQGGGGAGAWGGAAVGLGPGAAGLLQPQEAASPAYHEITAIPLMDPVLDQKVVLITQTDVTKRVDVERKLAELTAAQMSMLEQMFPRHVIEHMLGDPNLLSSDVGRMANEHPMVTVLFCDVVGFTSMSRHISPAQVAGFLNELYAEFDGLIEDYGLYQLDTMGDCYIVVGGLVERDPDGFHALVEARGPAQAAADAAAVVDFAKAILLRARQVAMPHNNEPVTLRIGCHSGSLVSGMLGTRLPKFTLFGDTMNTASRMESTCKAGAIQISDATHALLLEARRLAKEARDAGNAAWEEQQGAGEGAELPGPSVEPSSQGEEVWVPTGGVEVKGKGRMDTWLWVPSEEEYHNPLPLPHGRVPFVPLSPGSSWTNGQQPGGPGAGGSGTAQAVSGPGGASATGTSVFSSAAAAVAAAAGGMQGAGGEDGSASGAAAQTQRALASMASMAARQRKEKEQQQQQRAAQGQGLSGAKSKPLFKLGAGLSPAAASENTGSYMVAHSERLPGLGALGADATHGSPGGGPGGAAGEGPGGAATSGRAGFAAALAATGRSLRHRHSTGLVDDSSGLTPQGPGTNATQLTEGSCLEASASHSRPSYNRLGSLQAWVQGPTSASSLLLHTPPSPVRLRSTRSQQAPSSTVVVGAAGGAGTASSAANTTTTATATTANNSASYPTAGGGGLGLAGVPSRTLPSPVQGYLHGRGSDSQPATQTGNALLSSGSYLAVGMGGGVASSGLVEGVDSPQYHGGHGAGGGLGGAAQGGGLPVGGALGSQSGAGGGGGYFSNGGLLLVGGGTAGGHPGGSNRGHTGASDSTDSVQALAAALAASSAAARSRALPPPMVPSSASQQLTSYGQLHSSHSNFPRPTSPDALQGGLLTSNSGSGGGSALLGQLRASGNGNGGGGGLFVVGRPSYGGQGGGGGVGSDLLSSMGAIGTPPGEASPDQPHMAMHSQGMGGGGSGVGGMSIASRNSAQERRSSQQMGAVTSPAGASGGSNAGGQHPLGALAAAYLAASSSMSSLRGGDRGERPGPPRSLGDVPAYMAPSSWSNGGREVGAGGARATATGHSLQGSAGGGTGGTRPLYSRYSDIGSLGLAGSSAGAGALLRSGNRPRGPASAGAGSTSQLIFVEPPTSGTARGSPPPVQPQQAQEPTQQQASQQVPGESGAAPANVPTGVATEPAAAQAEGAAGDVCGADGAVSAQPSADQLTAAGAAPAASAASPAPAALQGLFLPSGPGTEATLGPPTASSSTPGGSALTIPFSSGIRPLSAGLAQLAGFTPSAAAAGGPGGAGGMGVSGAGAFALQEAVRALLANAQPGNAAAAANANASVEAAFASVQTLVADGILMMQAISTASSMVDLSSPMQLPSTTDVASASPDHATAQAGSMTPAQRQLQQQQQQLLLQAVLQGQAEHAARMQAYAPALAQQGQEQGAAGAPTVNQALVQQLMQVAGSPSPGAPAAAGAAAPQPAGWGRGRPPSEGAAHGMAGAHASTGGIPAPRRRSTSSTGAGPTAGGGAGGSTGAGGPGAHAPLYSQAGALAAARGSAGAASSLWQSHPHAGGGSVGCGSGVGPGLQASLLHSPLASSGMGDDLPVHEPWSGARLDTLMEHEEVVGWGALGTGNSSLAGLGAASTSGQYLHASSNSAHSPAPAPSSSAALASLAAAVGSTGGQSHAQGQEGARAGARSVRDAAAAGLRRLANSASIMGTTGHSSGAPQGLPGSAGWDHPASAGAPGNGTRPNSGAASAYVSAPLGMLLPPPPPGLGQVQGRPGSNQPRGGEGGSGHGGQQYPPASASHGQGLGQGQEGAGGHRVPDSPRFGQQGQGGGSSKTRRGSSLMLLGSLGAALQHAGGSGNPHDLGSFHSHHHLHHGHGVGSHHGHAGLGSQHALAAQELGSPVGSPVRGQGMLGGYVPGGQRPGSLHGPAQHAHTHAHGGSHTQSERLARLSLTSGRQASGPTPGQGQGQGQSQGQGQQQS